MQTKNHDDITLLNKLVPNNIQNVNINIEIKSDDDSDIIYLGDLFRGNHFFTYY